MLDIKTIQENKMVKKLLKNDFYETQKAICDWVLETKEPLELLVDEVFIFFFEKWVDKSSREGVFNSLSHKRNFIRLPFKSFKEDKFEDSDNFWEKVESTWLDTLKMRLDSDNSKDIKQRFYRYYLNVNTAINVGEQEEIDDPNKQKIDDFMISFINKQVAHSYSQNPLIDAILRPFDKVERNLPIYSFSNEISSNPLNQEQLLTLYLSHRKDLLNIQGPPGTGKTTLLKDIVASLYLNDKTVVIASSNNDAVDNVRKVFSKDKILNELPSIRLGNKEEMAGTYNELMENYIPKEIEQLPTNGAVDISTLLSKLNDLIYTRSCIDKEAHFFNQLFIDSNFKQLIENSNKEDLIAQIKTTLNKWSVKSNTFFKLKGTKNIFKKIYFYFWKRKLDKCLKGMEIDINPLTITYNGDIEGFFEQIITIFSSLNVLKNHKTLEDIQGEIDEVKSLILETTNDTQAALSNKNIKAWDDIEKIFIPNMKTTISNDKRRGSYSELFSKNIKDGSLWNGNDISTYFPVIFSTTLSLPSFVEKNKMDYLIIDEAAQTTIHSVLGLMKYFKNIIFLGDTAQLSAVVNLDENKEVKVFKETNLPLVYRNKNNSLPSIIENTLSPDHSIMLKDHWRCAPKIANFFNESYYNNELNIMLGDKFPGKLGVEIYKENAFQEIIPRIEQRLLDEGIELDKVALISPHKDINNIKTNISKKGTIHKFQGYENEVIIFYIKNKHLKNGDIDFFINDRRLMNVALSRAKKQFYLYIGDKVWEDIQKRPDKNQHELVKLIKYINKINNPNSMMNKIETAIDEKVDISTGEHVYSFIDSIDKELYDSIIKHDLNISFGCRDIDVNPLLKDIDDSTTTYELVIYNNQGVISLIIDDEKIIYKNTEKLNLNRRYPEEISLKETKKLMSSRESFWFRKMKKEVIGNSSENQLSILSGISFSTLLKQEYVSNKKHADFTFAKRTLNTESNRYEFNYTFLLELDDNTHNTSFRKRLDDKKNSLCKDNGITLLRVKI